MPVPAHLPKKRFGQHFLHDATVLHRIVSAMRPVATDRIVEIGPGLGALTLPLLRAVGSIDAIELDRDLIAPLEARCAPVGQIRLHQADALRFPFGVLRAEGAPLRVVGNLPYNISTPLLFHLMGQAEHLRDLHFMLQKDVVDRMVAAPGDAAYGRLSVMVQYYCHVEALFTVGPEAFRPAPAVQSAVVRLIPHAVPPVVVNVDHLTEIVRLAFAQRRKTVRNALRSVLEMEDIVNAGVAPMARPETLGLAAFAALSRCLSA